MADVLQITVAVRMLRPGAWRITQEREAGAVIARRAQAATRPEGVRIARSWEADIQRILNATKAAARGVGLAVPAVVIRREGYHALPRGHDARVQ